ncbi:hypothetical protein B0T18DRAFT_72257 [Schizothecium vesticola]|uniref:Uncharacterized protein n=1 Tax=Schizothecium vesticola TaxID=314040 RepID=A0AA40F5P0_9PEZI|nr:hypothetical protein B0T18DRAFT_72257 [Schizothecium vesticola]
MSVSSFSSFRDGMVGSIVDCENVEGIHLLLCRCCTGGPRWKKQSITGPAINPTSPLRDPSIISCGRHGERATAEPAELLWFLFWARGSLTPAGYGIGRACRTQGGSRSGWFTVLVDFPFWCSVHGCSVQRPPHALNLLSFVTTRSRLPSPVSPRRIATPEPFDPAGHGPTVRHHLTSSPELVARSSPPSAPAPAFISATLGRGPPRRAAALGLFPRANPPRRRLLRVIAARRTLCRRLVVASSLPSPSAHASRRSTADVRVLSRCRETLES